MALTSWCRGAGRHCWRCAGWRPLAPASLQTGSSPRSCPGWWPGWGCAAAARRSGTAGGCWTSAATCCCCCGTGTCIRRSRFRRCCSYNLTQASDRAPNSPCGKRGRAFRLRTKWCGFFLTLNDKNNAKKNICITHIFLNFWVPCFFTWSLKWMCHWTSCIKRWAIMLTAVQITELRNKW